MRENNKEKVQSAQGYQLHNCSVFFQNYRESATKIEDLGSNQYDCWFISENNHCVVYFWLDKTEFIPN